MSPHRCLLGVEHYLAQLGVAAGEPGGDEYIYILVTNVVCPTASISHTFGFSVACHTHTHTPGRIQFIL